jgi:arsenate reductase
VDVSSNESCWFIQRSKILTEDMIRKSTLRVNMGCVEKESCPTLFIHNVIDWNIEDPKDKSIEKVERSEM